MISFRQMGFKIIVFSIAGATIAVAQPLQIEAPPEIAEQVLVYSNEAAATNQNAILRVNIAKNKQCNTYTLTLIDKNSRKAIKENETCSANLPNLALQNAVFEIFGHPVENTNSGFGGSVKTILLGAGFVAAGVLLYYSNTPKPVYGYGKTSEEKK